MDKKYYTPEFHEFHYGFEYEDSFFNAHFTPKNFNFKDVEGSYKTLFIKALDNKQIRVKYLDREDIESLGWEQIGYDTFSLSGDIEKYELEFDPEYKTFIYETSHLKENLFKGEIKNKSELKKIMIQTGILNE